MADTKWINTNGGAWETAGNWDNGVPTSSNRAVFDAASFAANGKVVTIGALAQCAGLDASAADQTFTISGSVYNFELHGDFVGSSNLTMTFTGTAYVYSKATQNITQGGATLTLNRWYIDGSGMTVTNVDNMSFTGATYIKNGTWTTNNKNITTSGTWAWDGGTITLNFGSSIISVISMSLNLANTITLNAGTSTFITNSNFRSLPNITWYNVIINNAYSSIAYHPLVCTNLTINVAAVVNGAIQLGTTITVSGTLTLTGNNSTNYRLLVSSDTIGTPRTITCNGSIVASNVDFRDITGAGSANWNLSAITGLSGDCGGNSGITFTTAVPQYYKHTGGGTTLWSDAAKWFTDQALTVVGRVPLPQDDANFITGSFDSACTLSVNCPRIGKSLDMSAVNQAVTFTLANVIECYGSHVLGNNITPSGSFERFFYGRGNYNFNLYGKTIYSSTFNCPSGVYTNQNIFVTINTMQIRGGTFDINDFDVTIVQLFQNSGNLYLGNGVISIGYPASYLYMNLGGNVYCEGSTVKLVTTSGSADISFAGNGKIYNKVWFSGSHTGNYDITGSNTIAELIMDAGRKVRFTAGTTQNIAKITAVGTAIAPITWSSVTAATHTINYTGTNKAQLDYINLSYSIGTPANKLYAGSHSTDSGNNSGWIFGDFTPILGVFFTEIENMIASLIGEGVMQPALTEVEDAECELIGEGIMEADFTETESLEAEMIAKGVIQTAFTEEELMDAAMIGEGVLTDLDFEEIEVMGDLRKFEKITCTSTFMKEITGESNITKEITGESKIL